MPLEIACLGRYNRAAEPDLIVADFEPFHPAADYDRLITVAVAASAAPAARAMRADPNTVLRTEYIPAS